ncbi:MAG: T9SS type A sorting domain-containing protein, partial [Cryomorphaceae bacterium]
YDTDTLKDGGFMSISFDNGESYYNVIESMEAENVYYSEFPGNGFNAINLYSQSDTLYNGEFGYSGNSNGWVSTMLGWNVLYIAPPKGGAMDTIRFRFNFISDSVDNSREGWMVDDIYTFRVQILSSVKNQSKVLFKLYPNPASNRIMVETENDYQELKMEIRSITAKETIHFSSGSGNRLEADGIDLETGVYLVTVYGDDEFLGTARCVMQR